jgi:branched-chain amino acid transport system ATP-binding protein
VTALLDVDGLRAGYGASTVLDGLSFSMGTEAISIVGRNGVGKSTLCQALLGLVPIGGGTIRFKGQELRGLPPERIARSGLSLVPQGRRLFPSLTVEEHLNMLARSSRGKRWTTERVYKLFPRLAERRRNGGAELSGGEQQMLAVGRALLLNGDLVVMDEPSEGLAPIIVDTLIDAINRLVAEGTAVLVAEQNLWVATEIADRQLVMVSGRIELETTAADLRDDRELQQRYLGV